MFPCLCMIKAQIYLCKELKNYHLQLLFAQRLTRRFSIYFNKYLIRIKEERLDATKHQISQVICNMPKWSSDSEGEHSSAVERLLKAGRGIGSSGSASLPCLSNESLEFQQYWNNSLHLPDSSSQHTTSTALSLPCYKTCRCLHSHPLARALQLSLD